MTFALIFIFVLSIILLIGAYLIMKSDLPFNDKVFAILAILVLFAASTIYNEVKKSSYYDVKLSVAEFERLFFVPPNIDFVRIYKLPILDDFKTIVVDSLNGWNAEKPKSYEFGLIYSDRKVGKTLAFREYTKVLQGKSIPTLYIQINSPNTNIFQFAGMLKLSDIETLDETIQRFNDKDTVPNIIIDNIENAFDLEVTNQNSFPCSVCEYMRSLYQNKNVNIFFITNSAYVKDRLQTMDSYNKIMEFNDFHERNNTSVGKYLTDKINNGLKGEDKKFNLESIDNFVHLLGWDFEVLDEYVHNSNTYTSLKDFINVTLHKEAQRVSAYSGLQDVVKSMIEMTRYSARKNEWIPYGSIKSISNENPSAKLDEAIHAKIIVKNDNLFKFKNQLTYNAVLLDSRPKDFDDL